MKIKEILTESEILDEISRPEMSDAETILSNAGYENLGSGTFSSVHRKADSPHCLKLVYARDGGYRDFVRLAMQYPNPHFPKFKGKMMKITDNYYAIRMEVLERSWFLGDETEIMSNYIKFLRHQNNLSTQKVTPLSDAEEINLKMNELEKSQPGITKACEILGTKSKPTSWVDLHFGNAMMRGKTVVITDPFI